MKLSNISINYKLIGVILLPIICILFLASMKIVQLEETAVRQEQISELMRVSVAANNLVHEMQKERGASAGFTNSKGRAFADILVKQRQLTNEKRAELKQVLDLVHLKDFGEEYNRQLQAALDDLDKIGTMRNQVSALALPLSEVVGYYTAMNNKFLNITRETLFVAKDDRILRDVSAYLYFLQSKERAGIERAVGAAGFGGGWNNGLMNRFRNLITVQNTYMNVFLDYANDDALKSYNDAMADSSIEEVQQLRAIAFDAVDNGNMAPAKEISGEEWFQTITKKINILKQEEDSLAQNLIILAKDGSQSATSYRNFYLVILVGLSLLIIVFSYYIIKDLIQNIQNTKSIMEVLAKNETNVSIKGINRKDEIGEMSRSIAFFKEGLIEKKQLEEETVRSRKRAAEEKREAMESLATEFDTQVGGLIQSLSAAANQLQSSAQSMRAIADETSQSSEVVVQSSEDANQNVSTVASAMEEMASSSAEITSQINNTKNKSSEMSLIATDANEKIETLNDLVMNIGEVVNSIRDIADQTNLLALNATIEAARAGEAGKGFAVVADEVKKLANETGVKTTDIEERIQKIQEATKSSVHAMDMIINNIKGIDEAVVVVASAAEEQDATNNEISRSVTNASQSVQNVVSIIQEVKKGAGETGLSSDSVLAASQEMAALSDDLKVAVDKFLNKVRGE